MPFEALRECRLCIFIEAIEAVFATQHKASLDIPCENYDIKLSTIVVAAI